MDYIVLDIEFNGRKFASDKPMEVIEIGAVRLNDQLEEIDTFSALIKPVYFAKLNKFIRDKTGIVQEEIDQAEGFKPVVTEFLAWLQKRSDYLLLTWGKEDVKRIVFDTRMHEMDDSYWMAMQSLDLLKGYIKVKKHTNDISVESALHELGIETDGVTHRAFEDARSTAQIFKAVFAELDLSAVSQYVDTYTNAKERRMVKNAMKTFRMQKIPLDWDQMYEKIIKTKITSEETKKLEELRQYFESEKENSLQATKSN
ncbi:exonuclease domain-containing protein [Paenibacillus sp. N1-5-1-14]|uniref:3'-5' exonuclease n=1 Tax=Paenibacillus radicibacter TaxID=2972488 RepID=UPI00215913F6|nr:3'-5' exonuclease [Paenibacillus radicibacter]MCR8642511.1 exonuclease domain-containing protein [Paenibacillus radicibacter]